MLLGRASRQLRAVLCLVLLGGVAPAAAQQEPLGCGHPAFEHRYCAFELDGWTVRLNATLVGEQREVARAAYALLDDRLRRIVEVLPAQRVAELRRVPIWMEPKTTGAARLMYHPAGSAWAREHGFPEAKVGGVDIGDAAGFLSVRNSQPSVVLHELAHAYHDQVLGHDFAPIRDAYAHAAKSGLYEHVPRNDGNIERAYAITNYEEYFAELSEAYFGENDFFPFRRDELRSYDTQGFAMMRSAWEDRPPVAERRLAAAAAVVRSCTEEGSLRSFESRQPSLIVFRNEGERPVSVFWLDWQGVRNNRAEIPPGGLYAQRSFNTHPWLITAADGRCLGIILTEKDGSWIRL
jgi:hypothetical protein